MEYAKSVLAMLVAFVGSVVVGYTNDGVMETVEWWTAGGAGLSALALVWGVPNAHFVHTSKVRSYRRDHDRDHG